MRESKTIKCGVSCEYWNRSREFEVEVPAEATEAEIEAACREAAIEQAGFEWWIEDSEG